MKYWDGALIGNYAECPVTSRDAGYALKFIVMPLSTERSGTRTETADRVAFDQTRQHKCVVGIRPVVCVC